MVTHSAYFQKICAEFFGAEVSASSRAQAGLLEAARLVNLFGTQIAITGPLEVFSELVTCSPACCDIFAKERIPFWELPKTTPGAIGSARIHIQDRADCRHVLSSAFKAAWPMTGLNEAGALVKQSGLLTEVDLVVGLLENARSSVIPSPIFDTLLKPMGHLELGLPTEAGENLITKIEQEFRRVGNIDPSHYNQQYLLFLDEDGKFRVRPFGATSLGLVHGAITTSGPFIFRGGTIQKYSPQSPFGDIAIDELESLINSPAASEADLQRFFERYPEFLTGIDFGKAHPHPILHRDEGNPLIPDFFMEKLDTTWHSILDLKLPKDSMVIRRPNRAYFAQWVQEAIAQLKFYREWFDVPANCRVLEKRLGLSSKVFRPKLVLVAGRTRSFMDEVERLRLMENCPNELELWTYDQLVARAKSYRRMIRGTQ